jgi:hypothetical protein
LKDGQWVVQKELHLAGTMVEMKAGLRDDLLVAMMVPESVAQWELHLAETMVGYSAVW